MILKKIISCAIVLSILLFTSSCNEDKKWVEKGKKSLKNNNQEQSLVYFNKALEVNPNNKEALIEKGKILLLKPENTGEACICFDKALKIDPEDKNAWIGKGRGFCIQQKNKEALECFDVVLKKDPNDIEALSSKLLVLENQRDTNEVINCYKKISSIDKNTVMGWAKESVLKFLYEQGNILYNEGKYNETIDYCNKALELDPNSAVYLSSIGRVLYKQCKKEEAMKYFNKALEIAPEKYYTWMQKGYILCTNECITFSTEEDRESLTYFDKVDAIKKQKKEEILKPLGVDFEEVLNLYITAGNYIIENSNYEDALQNLNKALEIDDKFYPGWELKIKTLNYKMGMNSEASACCAELYKISKEDSKKAEIWAYALQLKILVQGFER